MLASNLAIMPTTCGRFAYNGSIDDPLPRWWTFKLDDAYSIEYLQVTGEGFDNSANNESNPWGPTAFCPIYSNKHLYAAEFYVSNDASHANDKTSCGLATHGSLIDASIVASTSTPDQGALFMEMFRIGGVVTCPSAEKFKYIHLSVNNNE